jgi:Sec1 family
MQRALDALPELKKLSSNVQKHVTLTTEISKLIGERNIMDVSKVEQVRYKKKRGYLFCFLNKIKPGNFFERRKKRSIQYGN